MPVAEASPCVAVKGGAVAANAKTTTTIRAGVSTAKPHGSPDAQGFQKVPKAPQGASVREWRRGQLFGISPGGERSVCGMSGRPIAAAPQLFVKNICMSHTGMSAPSSTVFLANIKPTAQKSRQRRRCTLSRSRRSARRGFSGTAAKTPPAPTTSEFLHSVVGFSLIQAQAWHKPSKNLLCCWLPRLRHAKLDVFAEFD